MEKHWSDKYVFLLTPLAEPYVFYYLFGGILGYICLSLGEHQKKEGLQLAGKILMIPFGLWLVLFFLVAVPIGLLSERAARKASKDPCRRPLYLAVMSAVLATLFGHGEGTLQGPVHRLA